MSGGQRPAVIDPEMVFEERNLVRRIQNALGIDKDDISADDTMEAAILYNTARQVELLTDLAGEGLVIENVSPNIDLGGATFDIEVESLRDAIREAHSEKVVELFDYDVADSELILTQSVTPQTAHSSYQVSIALSDPGALWADVDPENDAEFEFAISNNNMNPESVQHFQFQVSDEAKYNFYVNASAKIYNFRVQEVFTGSGGPFTDGQWAV